MIELMHAEGLRMFENDAAREIFSTLPHRIRVFRGTRAAEFDRRDEDLGVVWTTHPYVAYYFATKRRVTPISEFARLHDPRRIRPSDAVVLGATIARDDIIGMIRWDRLHELILPPRAVNEVREMAADELENDLEVAYAAKSHFVAMTAT